MKFLLLQQQQGVMWRLVWTLSLLSWSCEAAVTCKDENNGEVDWYILYKHPNSLTYTYVDLSGTKKGNKPISDPNGILAHTLNPIFQNMATDFGYISYNDQHNSYSHSEALFNLNVTEERLAAQDIGHSKGLVMVEKDDTGVWLLHSTPNFPLSRQHNNFWPSTGQTYGQTFICVTFGYEEFKKIGLHLQYIGANAFDKRMPDDFHQELKDAANGARKTPVTDLVELTSNRRTVFHSIAKPMGGLAKNGDLYVTISDKVDSDLYAQTWGGQAQRASSYCSGVHKVQNVDKIIVGSADWQPKSDHSKWCVAKDQNKPWTCIADVNRARSQYKRRGGALCIKNTHIYDIFIKFVDEYEDCKKKMMEMIYSTAQQGLDFMRMLVKVFV